MYVTLQMKGRFWNKRRHDRSCGVEYKYGWWIIQQKHLVSTYCLPNIVLGAENTGVKANVQVLAPEEFSFRWDGTVREWSWRTVWGLLLCSNKGDRKYQLSWWWWERKEGMVRVQPPEREFTGGINDRIWWSVECKDSGKIQNDLFSGFRYLIGCQMPATP